jgi:hypothetical protein
VEAVQAQVEATMRSAVPPAAGRVTSPGLTVITQLAAACVTVKV